MKARAMTIVWLFSAAVACAEEAEWNTLYGCLDEHKANVAAVVESVDEGAGLIVEVLCVNEGTEVANAMMRTRTQIVAQSSSYGTAFSSFLVVITREMREAIYIEKLRQR